MFAQKVLYIKYNCKYNKLIDISVHFGDIVQKLSRKIIIYECGFSPMPNHVVHLILSFICNFIIYIFDVEVYF